MIYFTVVVFLSTLTDIATQNLPLQWGYSDGRVGPTNWGNLDPSFKLCSLGKRQAPISLLSTDKATLSKAQYSWPNIDRQLTLNHTGVGLEVRSVGFTNVQIIENCTQYQLLNLHFHSPSEHTIDGKRYDLELHLLFNNLKLNRNKVVSFLFQSSSISPSPIFDDLPLTKVCNPNLGRYPSSTHFQQFRLGYLTTVLTQYKVWNYLGSTTTPPCLENTSWSVSCQILSVHPKKLVQLRKALSLANFRPIQKRSLNHKVGTEWENKC